MGRAVSEARWQKALAWEGEWWSDCANTYFEEVKQIVYAHHMGLTAGATEKAWPVFDMGKLKIVDIGGGPVSLLLKTTADRRQVVDPGDYPKWVLDRYRAAGVRFKRESGEEYATNVHFDEAWLYNVLQHVRDPKAVVANARRLADRVRIFEWINTEPNVGHPHELLRKDLDRWLGGEGSVDGLVEHSQGRTAYYGVFPA